METFFTNSDKVHYIIKSLNLTKTLLVSSIIIGDVNTGKKSLARYLFPDALLVSASDQKAVEAALESAEELIITDFEKLSNPSQLNFNNKRIIATANYMGNEATIDSLFAFIYQMPPLQERLDDAEYIKMQFVNEACKTLMLDATQVDATALPLNLTHNTKSLKRAVFLELMQHSMGAEEIEDVLYQYLEKRLEGNDGYREHLALYERPLIKAGLKKFGSQLQLAQVLGINRNTLRKKIHEHHLD